MSEGQQSVATGATNPVPAGFDALPAIDISNPNFTREGNRLLAELRAKGPVCRVQPIGVLGFLKWADCDSILRDFRTFSAAFERSKPVPGAEEETKIDTLLREDPPKHTRVRALMQQAFTPERVAAMEPHTRKSPASSSTISWPRAPSATSCMGSLCRFPRRSCRAFWASTPRWWRRSRAGPIR